MKNRHDPKYDPTAFESVEELYDFLMGLKLPEGMEIGHGHQPKLTSKKAMTVIWFLQEHMGLLPDHYERCDNCGNLYDSWSEGKHDESSGRCTCDNCL